MNEELWSKVLAFDFDDPPNEYGFSIRLANENYWTKSFTEQAILEYKKFMYLAATSDFMVSPSEVVDIVWHQHLIFTQSYQDFCNILGKQVQHIPSTHNKEDFSKFQQAKERTIRFYERDFGKQPENIWGFNGMFESLNLEKAKFKIQTLVIIGIVGFICLITPVYFLLYPVYRQIDNPYFIYGLIFMCLLAFVLLEYYNRAKLKQIVSQFDKSSFVYDLQPFELIYLESKKLPRVINGTINELIDNGTIIINSDNSIELVRSNAAVNSEQLQVINVLSETGKTSYRNLLRILLVKPVFGNIANCMLAFRKYFNKSKKFSVLFSTNFVVLMILLLLALTRVITGILRDKPIVVIVLTTIVLAVFIVIFLQRLTRQVFRTIMPDLYREEILPARQVDDNWQWSYFLLGTAVLTTSFAPLVKKNDGNNSSGDGGGCSSSCGSSCGSSCSSCGGCGGGGD